MKSVSVRAFRNRLATELEGDEPVLITRHGRNIAVVYPLRDPSSVPLDVRLSIVNALGDRLRVEPLRMSPAVIERYKRDVDRTLIRENLRRTPDQRLRALQKLQEFAGELRRAR